MKRVGLEALWSQRAGAVARTAPDRVSRRERGILGDSDFRSRLFFFSLFRNILTSVLEPPDVDPTATLCMPGCAPSPGASEKCALPNGVRYLGILQSIRKLTTTLLPPDFELIGRRAGKAVGILTACSHISHARRSLRSWICVSSARETHAGQTVVVASRKRWRRVSRNHVLASCFA